MNALPSDLIEYINCIKEAVIAASLEVSEKISHIDSLEL
jgi:hypothetical protein